ncbi:MAG: winged helix-turn-helix transcriptional regulator [Streptosporangiaceae bacterium]
MTSAQRTDDAAAFDVFARACPSRSTLEHVTGRWGSLVLVALVPGPRRFNELRRRVDGVSQKILAQTLQALERDGLVHRELFSTFPLRVEYSLTPVGRPVAGRLTALFRDLEAQMPAILAAQRRCDQASRDR